MWKCYWLLIYKKMSTRILGTSTEPLNPRDAFFGGITNASKLKVTHNKLRFVDMISLHPTVMFL